MDEQTARQLVELLTTLNQRIETLNERLVGMSIWRNERLAQKRPEDYTDAERQRLMSHWMRPRAY